MTIIGLGILVLVIIAVVIGVVVNREGKDWWRPDLFFNTNKNIMHKDHGVSSGIYGLGFIGAAVYYIQQATSFGDGVLKALVWPAFLVHKLLEFLKM